MEPREPELDARRSSEIAVKKHPEMSTRPQKCVNIMYSSLMNSNHESSHSSVCGWKLQPPCQHGCSNLEADKLDRRTWTCQP